MTSEKAFIVARHISDREDRTKYLLSHGFALWIPRLQYGGGNEEP